MNIYIWRRVNKATLNYHTEGGVVVFADSYTEAIQLANSIDGCEISADEKPDEIRPCAKGEKNVFIMPDAGCC